MLTIIYVTLAIIGAALIGSAVFTHVKTNWKTVLIGAAILLSLVVGFYHGQNETIKDATLEWVNVDGEYAITYIGAGTHLYS